MGLLSNLLDLTHGIVILLDNLIGPWAMAYNFYKVDGGSAIKFFYYIDLPINFKQSVLLQKYTYWYRVSTYIIKRTCVFKVFYPYSFAWTKKNQIFNATTIVTNITVAEHRFTLDTCNFYSMYSTRSFTQLVYSFMTFFTDLRSEYGLKIRVVKHEIGSLAKLHNLFIYGFSLNNNLPKLMLIQYWTALLQIRWFKYIGAFVNVFVAVVGFCILSFLFASIFFRFENKIRGMTFFFQKLLKEHDQELASHEDILIFVVFFLAFFINTLNIYTNTELVQYNINLILWMLYLFLFSLVVMVPISILFTTGVNCLVYIKGTDKYNSLLSYIVFDAITVLAFFLRFFLQVIRWCLFLATYYLLHEFVFEWSYSLITSVFNSIFLNTSIYQWMSTNLLFSVFINTIRFLFELFDTFLILLIQITAFIAVILWLFNFLFSTSTDDVFENKLSNLFKNIMLKNIFNTIKIKNFLKSGLFGDYTIKTIVNNYLRSINMFVVMFLEKFIIEYTPKNMWKLFNVNNQGNFLSTKFFGSLFLTINFVLAVFLFICF